MTTIMMMMIGDEEIVTESIFLRGGSRAPGIPRQIGRARARRLCFLLQEWYDGVDDDDDDDDGADAG